MKITLNHSKIIDNFGNLSLFAKEYGIKLGTLNYHTRYRSNQNPHFRSLKVFQALKKMQADGYITMEYHNGN
ncbi:hypothetical protein NHP200010_15270 [Helicobacter bizzozeronii]|uniref:hypothetical protein n=1 Tax=Helicobacter bizzozeronii TaxID=56877 RepID=UPI00244D98C2|nr:hypothetical protein [Helicobacter bizzozeronii]GMB93795.1 hypothetical protein NHP200010_15270 [Helicobacter bizzozeronii]